MEAAERQAMAELRQELGQLRTAAMRAAGGFATRAGSGLPAASADVSAGTARARAGRRRAGPGSGGPDGRGQRVAEHRPLAVPGRQDDYPCLRATANNLRAADEYTDLDSPDYIQLYTYSDLDALFELYGHLRAANPANQVDLRIADMLTPDEYSSISYSLGGIDWNTATGSLLQELQLPVRQIVNWGKGNAPGDVYFEASRTVRSSVPNSTKSVGRINFGSMSRFLREQ